MLLNRVNAKINATTSFRVAANAGLSRVSVLVTLKSSCFMLSNVDMLFLYFLQATWTLDSTQKRDSTLKTITHFTMWRGVGVIDHHIRFKRKCIFITFNYFFQFNSQWKISSCEWKIFSKAWKFSVRIMFQLTSRMLQRWLNSLNEKSIPHGGLFTHASLSVNQSS